MKKSNIIYVILKKNKDRELIEAEKFQEYILREQISDIVAYIRANIEVQELHIKSLSNLNFHSDMRLPIEEMKIEGDTKVSTCSEYELKITSNTKLKISEKRNNFVWIDDFKTLETALDNFNGGKFSEVIAINNSYDFNFSEARRIKMNTSLMQEKKFLIEFKA